MFRYLPFVLKNSWRNRRRTMLTIVSISVSLCLLGVLMAIYYAFYFTQASPSQALRLVVRNKISPLAHAALLPRQNPPGAGRPESGTLPPVRRRLSDRGMPRTCFPLLPGAGQDPDRSRRWRS